MNLEEMTAEALVTLFNETKDPSYELFDTLSRQNEAYIRELAANSSLCPPDVLARLANDTNHGVIARVANNPACPRQVFDTIIDIDDMMIQAACCGNSAIPFKVIAPLLNGLNQANKLQLAEQSGRLALEVMEYLAVDDSDLVRCCIAKRPGLPPALLAKLANDKAPIVRQSVLDNPDCSDERLLAMSYDADESVRGYAGGCPRLPSARVIELLSEPSIKVRKLIASRNSSDIILRQLFKMSCAFALGDAEVLIALAGNEHTPRKILSELPLNQNKVVDGVYRLQRNLAANKNTPAKVLFHLAFGFSNGGVFFKTHNSVTESAQETLIVRSSEQWAQDMEDGCTLSWVIDVVGGGKKSVGACLLDAGMNALYQRIQAAELLYRVEDITNINASPLGVADRTQPIAVPVKPRL